MKINVLTRNIYSTYSISDIKRKMLFLGITDEKIIFRFLNFRLITSFVIFFMLLYLSDWGYVLGPVVVILYYIFLPRFTLDVKIKKRKQRLERDALYFFEILVLSLESGNNLFNAIVVTVDNVDSELSREFKKMIHDTKYGKSFDEALLDMKNRIPSYTIGNILLNIREANIFGNSIVGTLNNQLEYLRETKVLETKAYISKIPLKISVVSVAFFVPLLLMLILGPVLLKYFS